MMVNKRLERVLSEGDFTLYEMRILRKMLDNSISDEQVKEVFYHYNSVNSKGVPFVKLINALDKHDKRYEILSEYNDHVSNIIEGLKMASQSLNIVCTEIGNKLHKENPNALVDVGKAALEQG